MSRTRDISIYLLKNGVSVNDAFKNRDSVEAIHCELPNSHLFIVDSDPKAPWWKEYLQIHDNIEQVFKGGLLFLNAGGRIFVVSFGNGYHKLNDEAYEYDFGLRCTLNSINPAELKSTDILQPENAIRQRIQPPKSSDLDFFDFDKDSSIIKKLSGKVLPDYNDLFSNTTGTSSLRLSTKQSMQQLPSLCEQLLAIYQNNNFRDHFPDLNNIQPVKDPAKIRNLEAALVNALNQRSNEITFTIPDIIDYESISGIQIPEIPTIINNADIEISSFYNVIHQSNFTVETLHSIYHVELVNDDGVPRSPSYPFYKCLLWDYTTDNNQCYHLCDGSWFQIENDFLRKLTSTIDPCFERYELPPYNHNRENGNHDEGAYNQDIADKNNQFICLDKTNIATEPNTNIEPCDIYTVQNGFAYFIHIKIGTRSSLLSHLFNQGINSLSLINSETEAKENLKRQIRQKIGNNNYDDYINPIDSYKIKVVFAIVTNKDPMLKSKILPLFSRISLKRTIQELRSRNVNVIITVIKDNSR